MNVNVNKLRSRFADLKYEQLLTEKYFIETCFSKKFDSNPPKEQMRDIAFTLKAFALKCDGIAMIDCNLQNEFCESDGDPITTTTTTTSSTTTTTTDPDATTTTTSTTSTTTAAPTTTTTTTTTSTSTTTTTTAAPTCSNYTVENPTAVSLEYQYNPCDGGPRVIVWLPAGETQVFCAITNSQQWDSSLEMTLNGLC